MSSDDGENTPQWHQAEYCEGCGTLISASDEIIANVREPVHRVDIIEAIGEFEEVGESTADERGDCDDCGGQIVHRAYFYPASEIPETDYEPDQSQITGRDPDEDALIETPGRGWQEAREVSWIEEGDGDGE